MSQFKNAYFCISHLLYSFKNNIILDLKEQEQKINVL